MDWFERDEFWADLEAKIYGEEQHRAAVPEAEAAMAILGLRPPAEIVDLCCGNGRHSLALARLGYRVTGVDLSDTFIRRAETGSAQLELPVEWVRADIRSFERPDSFDAAIIMWNAFGYFSSEADDLLALSAAYRSLRSGGTILVQTHGVETTARKFVRKDWFEVGDSIVCDQRWIEEDWSRMRTRYVICGPTGRKEHTMTCRLYSPAELSRLLQDAGFVDVHVFGNLSGAPYDEKAFELVVSAQRP